MRFFFQTLMAGIVAVLVLAASCVQTPSCLLLSGYSVGGQ